MFISGQTDLLKLYARVVSCSRAKLNLFVDKRQFEMSVSRSQCLGIDLIQKNDT